MFVEKVWLLEPASEACKNTTAHKKKVSQTREHIPTILLAILRTQEYTRSGGRCLATDSHKYPKETMNNCNINQSHLPL